MTDSPNLMLAKISRYTVLCMYKGKEFSLQNLISLFVNVDHPIAKLLAILCMYMYFLVIVV